ncbi:putative glycine d-amino acid deaminating protein [Phaeoacremonium minimum UCRPA7]|uniref:Putative glycine d-amino acid deaminating protein n=1 Tax=Phaeoacremonium minimum (strain UCR-PA7) TaxID=1286976 RepID=R8BUQ0_PHAM7|nr:putative glycine d-amino acid deaminating protein [Phaeoacremonium minimum UCRPA7]EOO03019.1 putative glycine d-amino acid deaminating protein [Phaeoacremonium minimum UCRPA7]
MSAQDENKPHVVVVGGGIVGASIAWHLTRQNASVTIVASDLGGTATPNSFAWLNASRHNPRFYYDLRRRSMVRWRELADEVPGLKDLVQWCGTVEWDLSRDELANYEKQHSAWGYDIHRAEHKEIAEREPYLSEDVIPEWGLRIGEEGAVEAADAASLLIAQAEAQGARVLSTTVTNITKSENSIHGVTTASGENLSADHVVLAAGVGSTELCTSVGVTLPVTGRSGLLVHSKPVAHRILNGLIISDGPHMRQTAAGRVVAGAGFAGGDPGEDPQVTSDKLFAKVKGMFKPEANGVDTLELDFFTVGYRPTPLDGLPILGASGLKGLTLAVMHSGVTLAAIVGEVLADEIVHGTKDPALDAFALSRFN